MAEVTLDDLAPQLVCSVRDEELGELGWVIVDRALGSFPSGGGIRLAPSVTKAELAHLARSMTLKWSFLGIHHGGAKAAVTVPEALVSARRRDVFEAFGRALEPLIRRRVYFPGEDLGTTPEDIDVLRGAIGLPPHDVSKIDGSLATAMTVVEAVRRSAASLGIELGRATAALEGLGRVGGHIAALLAAEGVRIVAVSTAAGAIRDDRGLDVDTLLALRATHGADLVDHYPQADRLELAELLTLPVDLLVPGARTWSLNSANAASVAARLVVPAANAPATPAAERTLFDHGVLTVPDFVSNCGGILASQMANAGLGLSEYERTVGGAYGTAVSALLVQAADARESMTDTATRLAWRSFERMRSRPAGAAGGSKLRRSVRVVREGGAAAALERIGSLLYRRSLVTAGATRYAAAARFDRRLEETVA